MLGIEYFPPIDNIISENYFLTNTCMKLDIQIKFYFFLSFFFFFVSMSHQVVLGSKTLIHILEIEHNTSCDRFWVTPTAVQKPRRP